MKFISVQEAPDAIGPYCHAIGQFSLLFRPDAFRPPNNGIGGYYHKKKKKKSSKQNPLDALVEIECIAEIE